MCPALLAAHSLRHRSHLINKQQTRANRTGSGALLGPGVEGERGAASAGEGGRGVTVQEDGCRGS